MKHIVSVSSGVDSQATLILALESYGSDVIALFCDTGNEHDLVYEHLDYMEQKHEIKIERLKSDFETRIKSKRKFVEQDQRPGQRKGKDIKWSDDRKKIVLQSGLKATGNPMLDLCQWKGCFPARLSQFCTEQLKVNNLKKFQDTIRINNSVTNWQGIRRDESRNRINSLKDEQLADDFFIHRPVVDLTKQEVFKLLKVRSIKHNPLYDIGFSRVGCLPCINANKKEIALIAKLFPKEIDRIREWEEIVCNSSKTGFSSFFHARTRGLNAQEAMSEARIDNTVLWALTTHGGRQFPLFEHGNQGLSETCMLAAGMCE